jgi:hypothetical protein
LIFKTYSLKLFFTEPNENWTIEELMQWCLLKSQSETDQKLTSLLDALDKQFSQGKDDMIRCQEIKCADKLNASSKLKCIHVAITTGPHANETAILTPTEKCPCWVGRSGSKKFVTKGISLRNDLEVSTTHGKFEVLEGIPYFTDTGSSNGTLLDGKEMEPNVAREINDGTKLTFGSSVCIIRLEMA